jgi:hypothetical protein
MALMQIALAITVYYLWRTAFKDNLDQQCQVISQQENAADAVQRRAEADKQANFTLLGASTRRDTAYIILRLSFFVREPPPSLFRNVLRARPGESWIL